LPPERSGEPSDVVCVGFGPAGIALATAIEDALEAGDEAPSAVFLDRAASSAWQPDMLLQGTDIQHHFLRDFATPRNPRSRFTFANYLREQGRLFPFCLFGARVGRIEWSQYVEWTAGEVTLPVRYRHDVLRIEPVLENGSIERLLVVARDLDSGLARQLVARNVVLSLGQLPSAPPLFEPLLGPAVFHSSTFLRSIRRFRPEDRPTFAVVGAGQNAGEIILDLAHRFPDSTIYSLARNSGFRTYDLGHFSNQVYFPEETDYFHGLPRAGREAVFENVRLTNYSSVDPDVSSALYLLTYEERLLGRERIHMLRRVQPVEARKEDGRYRLVLEEVYRRDRRAIDVDAIVLCTGFREQRFPALLDGLRPYLRLDEGGDLDVSRAYRVRTDARLQARIYLNGLTEWRHGISNATSFSMTALRAQEILDDIRRDEEPWAERRGGEDLATTAVGRGEARLRGGVQRQG
jgi:L-ornithine N5-oxygenase